MNVIQKLYSWYGKRTVLIVGTALLVLIISLLYIQLGINTDESDLEAEQVNRSVTIAPIGSLSSGSTKSHIGTIQAVSKASVQAEAGGRVISVSSQIGNQVRAGQVLVQLENSAERAAVVQAEGVYESALAGAAQGESGVRSAETAIESAKNTVLSAIRSAYTTSNNTLLTKIDVFFSSPLNSVPGVRISGRGETQYLNSERVQWQTAMPDWQTQVTNATIQSDLNALLNEAEVNTSRMISLIDTLIRLTREQPRNNTLDGIEIESYTQGLLTERTLLSNVLTTLESARSGLVNAEESLSRAQISSAGETTSLADAQIKQALGALQSAQARLAKTAVRAPINGTINTIDVEVGDFLGAGTTVAEIVNQNAFEISVYLTELERAQVVVGQPVTINETYSGTVTNIAPALDARTQKIEVKIGVDTTEVLSGSTAIVSFDSSKSAASVDQSTLMVPVQAIAFAVDQGSVLGVEDGRVVAIPVSIGALRGSSVEVEGIEPSVPIITDARGLIVGQEVAVANQ